jgi:hypothetical protein
MIPIPHPSVILALCVFSSPSSLTAQTLNSPPNPPAPLRVHLLEAKEVDTQTANSLRLEAVPSYLWHHGCAPTAVAMILGYLDQKGFPYLFPGSAAVEWFNGQAFPIGPCTPDTIASLIHYQDYCLPRDDYSWPIPDLSVVGDAHPDDCIADFLHTSRSSDGMNYGSTPLDYLIKGTLDFIQNRHPEATVTSESFATLTEAQVAIAYEVIKKEIAEGRPVLGVVDSDADGWIDHAIPIWGFDESTNRKGITCWDSWYHYPREIALAPVAYGQSFGCFSIHTLKLTVEDRQIQLHAFAEPSTGKIHYTCSDAEKTLWQRHHPERQYLGALHRTDAPGISDETAVPVYRFKLPSGAILLTASRTEKTMLESIPGAPFGTGEHLFNTCAENTPEAFPVFRIRHIKGHYAYSANPDAFDFPGNEVNNPHTIEGVAWWALPLPMDPDNPAPAPLP